MTVSDSEKFTVYGRPGCGYCSAAVSVLTKLNASFEYIDVYDTGLTKDEVGQKMGHMVFTWPQIQHGDQYVGGYTELMAYLARQ